MEVPTSASSDVTNGEPFLERPAAAPPKDSDAEFLLGVAKNHGTYEGMERLKAIATRLAAPPSDAAQPEEGCEFCIPDHQFFECPKCGHCPARILSRYDHPEDAPEGPYCAEPSDVRGDSRWMVTYQDEKVGCIYGTKGEIEDIRDVLNRHELNRLKGDK